MNSRLKLIALVAIVLAPSILLVASRMWLGPMQGLQPGEVLPAAVLVDEEGARVDTGGWKGAPTLLVLFKTGCDACKSEIDRIASLAPQLGGIRIALVSIDRKRPREPVPFRVYMDPEGGFIRRIRRTAVPTLYWTGRDGRVLYGRSGQRPIRETAEVFRQLLSVSE